MSLKGILLAACIAAATPASAISPHVQLNLDDGSGSAFYIGDGLFVTAAHVVEDETNLTLTAEDGSTRKAALQDVNVAFDIAVLTADPKWVDAAPLECAVPKPGAVVVGYGNPLKYTFLQFHGFVAGRQINYSHWPSVVPLDMLILPGDSGGAVMSDGKVVGVMVGGTIAPTASRMDGAMVGIGLAVPADVVCMLLGRGAADLPKASK